MPIALRKLYMFKIFVIGAVVYFIYRQIRRDPRLTHKKPNPFIQSRSNAKESQNIEDIDYIEHK